MASQDGFTLYDTVAYNYRHNEENGENNQDGSEYNYSWNCGLEGPTRKMAVKKMRDQQIKNAFLMLLLSQGTPVIYGGDEFCNSQNGKMCIRDSFWASVFCLWDFQECPIPCQFFVNRHR